MAEIKSTMEMVLERAARMTASSTEQPDSDKLTRQGMRLAASFLQDITINLAGRLEAVAQDDQPAHLQGITTTLLRNIVLPREDENLDSSQNAMQGLLQVNANNPDLANVLQEMNNILSQYGQHKKQLREQLEQQLAPQLEQMEAKLAQQTGAGLKLSPAQHPKFQEEWQRLRMELNDQYSNALEQHKTLIRQLSAK